jgi:hypothetical protein
MMALTNGSKAPVSLIIPKKITEKINITPVVLIEPIPLVMYSFKYAPRPIRTHIIMGIPAIATKGDTTFLFSNSRIQNIVKNPAILSMVSDISLPPVL